MDRRRRMALLDGAVFVTSSFTNGNASCVAVALLRDGSVAIRNSNFPDAGVVFTTPEEWNAFAATV